MSILLDEINIHDFLVWVNKHLLYSYTQNINEYEKDIFPANFLTSYIFSSGQNQSQNNLQTEFTFKFFI